MASDSSTSIPRKMSSLSSRSIRNKSSSILSLSNPNSLYNLNTTTTSNPNNNNTLIIQNNELNPTTTPNQNNNNNNNNLNNNNPIPTHNHHHSISSGSTTNNINTTTSQGFLNSNSARSINEDDSMIWQNESSISSQSLNLNNNNTNNNNNSHSTTPPINQSITPSTPNTIESLLTLAHKRITTLVYLKKVHEGKVHWFNTILLSRAELEKWFEHHRMIHRTTRFVILGMSISSLLEINILPDFLKAMMNLLHEFESIPNDNFKPKISSLSRGIFKQSSKSIRKSSGATDYSITLQDSGDPSFLYAPNIPFDLDYFEVWITLSDILVEVYQKIIKFISASSSSTNHHVTNPNTPAAPGPLSTGSASITPVLNNISVPIPPTRSSSNYSIVSNYQAHLNSQHIELITRIDSKLKKVIVTLTKEIDGMARTAIREELAQLDPMLSNSTCFNLSDLSQNNEWD